MWTASSPSSYPLPRSRTRSPSEEECSTSLASSRAEPRLPGPATPRPTSRRDVPRHGRAARSWAWRSRSGWSHGALSNLALIGRRAPDAAATIAIQALEAQGASVLTFPADVADLSALRAVFARVDEAMPSLRGIVHCAGVIDDALLADQTWARFEGLMNAKLEGAANLDTLTRERRARLLRALLLCILAARNPREEQLRGGQCLARRACVSPSGTRSLRHRRELGGLGGNGDGGRTGEVHAPAHGSTRSRLDSEPRRPRSAWPSLECRRDPNRGASLQLGHFRWSSSGASTTTIRRPGAYDHAPEDASGDRRATTRTRPRIP